MILGITGHRPSKLGGYGENALRARIRTEMRLAFKKLKPTLVLSGMALGVDQWACELALSLKIPFDAYVPFDGQESKWPLAQQVYYRKLLSAADKITFCASPGHAGWKMQRRNEMLVNACDHLLAVFTGSPGGTANCISYAERQNRPITIINPDGL